LAPGTGVEIKMPALKISGLSGEKGSTSGGTLSHKIFAAVP
jgi:hypothetical protein